MKLGICLSGGGFRSLAFIGVIKALEENNIKPQMMSGCSAGSIISALYACGYTAQEIHNFIQKYALNVIDINYLGIIKSVLNFIVTGKFKLDGIIKGDKLEKIINELTEGKTLSQTNIPILINASDINNADQILFLSKKTNISKKKVSCLYDAQISTAVRASISIPALFSPKHYNDLTLVDGGIINNMPFNYLLDMGADKIIAINMGYNGQLVEGIKNVFDIALQSLDIMGYNMIENAKNDHGIIELNYKNNQFDVNANKQILIINPGIFNVGVMETSKTEEVIERGYQFAVNYMDMIKMFLDIPI